MNKIIGTLYIILIPCFMWGQVGSHSLNYRNGGGGFWNPALAANVKGINIQGLNIQSQVYNSAFGPESAITSQDGINTFNFNPVIDQLSDQNNVLGDITINTLGITLELVGMNVSLGHRMRYTGDGHYSREAIELMTFGNARFIGEQIDIGPAFSYQHYHELYVGLAREFGGLRIGGRVKFLGGNEYVGSQESRMMLTTEEEFYALSFSNNYIIESSRLFNYNGIDDVSFDFDFSRLPPLFADNSGLAFDLGLSLDVGDSGELMFSIQDMGAITWDKEAKVYKSSGDFSYTGIDLLDYLSDDGDVNIADSLYNLLQFEEKEVASFKRSIPRQWTLAYHMSTNETDGIIAAVSGKSFNGRNLMSTSLGYRRSLSERFVAALQFRSIGKSYLNIGGAVEVDFDAFGFYLVLENIPALIQPLAARYNGIHTGFYLSFGD
jgi:hypothetical protein